MRGQQTIRILLFGAILAAIPLLAASLSAQTPHVVVRPQPRVGPPWLGLTLETREATPGAGVLVTGTLRRSPSEGTGVKPGDRIVAVEGDPVSSRRQITSIVRQRGNGEKVTVTVKRGERQVDFDFTLSPMPSAEDVVRNHLIGFDAPDFRFRYVGDNKNAKLSSLKGKPTILEFWATWCGPCHLVQQELATVKDQFGEQINIVGVSEEDAKTVRKHLEAHPSRYAMGIDDGSSRNEYGVQSIPMVVVLDAEHRVAAVIIGAQERDQIAKKLRNLLPEPAAKDTP